MTGRAIRPLLIRALQGIGILVLLAVLAVGGLAAAHWRVVHGLVTMSSRGVEVLDGYTPIEIAAGRPGTHELAVAAPGDQTVSAAALAEAQAYSDKLGGFALIVWQGGRIVDERYAPGFEEHSRFETFSMHKSVLGLVYGAALRDGLIGSLDDRADKYLEEWRGDPRGAITLRQLLTMESGLHPPSMVKHELAAYEIAFGSRVTQSALQETLAVPPGTRFAYNGANSQIAGAILNRRLRATGRGDYAAYVSKVLLQPLGTGDVHLWLEHDGGDPRFFAHFQMAARDWLRMGILVAQSGSFDGAQVLPASWIAQMETPSALNPDYGLQVWLGAQWHRYRSYGPDFPIMMSHEKPYVATDLVYFDGFGGERVYISPSRDLVIVRIGRGSMAFDDSIIPNAVVAGMAGH